MNNFIFWKKKSVAGFVGGQYSGNWKLEEKKRAEGERDTHYAWDLALEAPNTQQRLLYVSKSF